MYGAWILEPCTHRINRKVNIDSENEKGAEGLSVAQSHAERRREFILASCSGRAERARRRLTSK